jgi:hypothetical protein
MPGANRRAERADADRRAVMISQPVPSEVVAPPRAAPRRFVPPHAGRPSATGPWSSGSLADELWDRLGDFA